MQFSVREVKARFTEAADAAVKGERVVVTKHGKPFVELIPATQKMPFTWERAAEIRKELGIVSAGSDWFEEFNDPAFSRRVLGLED